MGRPCLCQGRMVVMLVRGFGVWGITAPGKDARLLVTCEPEELEFASSNLKSKHIQDPTEDHTVAGVPV